MLRRLIIGLLAVLFFFNSCTKHQTTVKAPFQKATSSFLFVLSEITFQTCEDMICIPGSSSAVGSGFLIATNGTDSFGVTAGHVCEADPDQKIVERKMHVSLYNGISYDAEPLAVYSDQDVCILRIHGLVKGGLSMGSPPVRGEVVYTASAPFGINDVQMVPLFDGYYAGRRVSRQLDAYTIPSAPGSSGAPIVNKSGGLVGMTILKYYKFENLCLSPPYEFLKDIVNGVKNDVRKRNL